MRTLAKCLASQNFQVAERTLLIWQNEHLMNDGILKKQHNGFVLPFILPALLERKDYWHVAVTNLSSQLIQNYQSDDIELYDECKNQYEQRKRKELFLQQKVILKLIQTKKSKKMHYHFMVLISLNRRKRNCLIQ